MRKRLAPTRRRAPRKSTPRSDRPSAAHGFVLTASGEPAASLGRPGAASHKGASTTPATPPAATHEADAPTNAPKGRAAPTVEVVTAGGCTESVANSVEGKAAGLTATYWLRADTTPWSVKIRFVGRRVGTTGQDPLDRFELTEQVTGLPPGAGRTSVTTKVAGINPGEWQVTAAPVPSTTGAERPAPKSAYPVSHLTTGTGFAPLLHGPGVHQWTWPVLVLLGVLVALVTQALLLERSTGRWGGTLGLTIVGVLVGYVAAKTWYLMLHRQSMRRFIPAGTCIQGFLLGTFGTLTIGALLTGTSVGLLLDATAPGLFLAMAIGRPGCFLGGCCVGRPTVSRWGLWSSDRRIGVRRIPVQLFEAAIALTIAAGTLALFLTVTLPLPGALFVGAVAAYTLGRQLLFPLRWEPRRTSTGRFLTLVGAGVVAVLAVVASVLAAG